MILGQILGYDFRPDFIAVTATAPVPYQDAVL